MIKAKTIKPNIGVNNRDANQSKSQAAKKAGDRRGVSEIKRSEAALRESNEELQETIVSFEHNSKQDKVTIKTQGQALIKLGEKVESLQTSMTNMEIQHSDELALEKSQMNSKHATEMAAVQQKLDKLMTFLESSGYDPVALLKTTTTPSEIAADKIDAMVKSIKESTDLHQQKSNQTLLDLKKHGLQEDDLEHVEPPAFDNMTNADWADVIAH
eukprot:m.266395 g.266395  ORF g.266395 m.266395 type:complete len:214 (+) comp67113_c0_seq1:89-730(+)